jgi:hypothetical protein
MATAENNSRMVGPPEVESGPVSRQISPRKRGFSPVNFRVASYSTRASGSQMYDVATYSRAKELAQEELISTAVGRRGCGKAL